MVNIETKESLQWHPGFVDTFKIESQPDAERMTIQSEYQLGAKPKEIDILAVKDDEKYECQQDITRIFRKHNIIEYKGPDESLSANDYYKVLAYTYFYIGDANHVLENHPADMTVTFVCNHYPREMLRHLGKMYGIVAENAEAGVYYLDGSPLPMQIIINHELDPQKYLWLYSLRGNLNETELLAVLRDYEVKKENKQYEAAMELITRANWKKLKEMRGMCQALDELMADKYREKEQLGERNKLISQIKKKLLKGKTFAEIADALEEEVIVIQSLAEEIEYAIQR